MEHMYEKKRKTQKTIGRNRWVHNAGSEMLIKEVLSPLLDIIFLYKESSCYNYVPGTNEDCNAGWAYFEKRFQRIYRGLDQNLYISYTVYEKVYQIIEEIQQFVRGCSGVDGLAERYFEVNPDLRFYRCAFTFYNGSNYEESQELYEMMQSFGRSTYKFDYEPEEEDFPECRLYFAVKEERNKECNFGYDRDDFFVLEMAYTLRLMFLEEIGEYDATAKLGQEVWREI